MPDRALRELITVKGIRKTYSMSWRHEGEHISFTSVARVSIAATTAAVSDTVMCLSDAHLVTRVVNVSSVPVPVERHAEVCAATLPPIATCRRRAIALSIVRSLLDDIPQACVTMHSALRIQLRQSREQENYSSTYVAALH